MDMAGKVRENMRLWFWRIERKNNDQIINKNMSEEYRARIRPKEKWM